MNFKLFIDECETIADAFDSIEEFEYGQSWDINAPNHKYPFLLMTNPTVVQTEEDEGGYEAITYRFNMMYFGDYDKNKDSNADLRQIQNDLQKYASEFNKELFKRSNNNADKWVFLDSQPQVIGYRVGNDSKAVFTDRIEVKIWSNCTTGTFSYA